MPIHGYPGNIVTANPTAPTSTTASGVWTLEQQLQAQAAGNWPQPPLPVYQISRSLRFNSADSAYLDRTPASAGNQQTWTWSGWVKRSKLGTTQYIFVASQSGFLGRRHGLFFNSSDQIEVVVDSGATFLYAATDAVFRDVSAWYHITAIFDSTQATATDRFKVYVNNVQQTQTVTQGAWTNIVQNNNYWVNSTVVHYISRDSFTAASYGDFYSTEINFIDGSALDPTSFGEYNEDTGVWQPIEYTGARGTNGFYLDFADNSSTTALGYDAAGSNDWTPNNFSVTAGAGNDSLVDTPTNYGTDTGAGGEVRGSYCTLNPLDNAQGATLSNGNLQAANVSNDKFYRATFGMSSGKWYWEVQFANLQNRNRLGITDNTINASGTTLTGDYALVSTGNQSYNTSTASTPTVPTFATNDYICFAYDADAGILYFEKNATPNTSTSPKFTGLSTSKTYFITCQEPGTASTNIFNFGQRAFQYTATSGFKALCTQNLPEPTIVDGGEYFNTVLYTGNGSTQSITGVGFQPDWVWIKTRSSGVGSTNHFLFDAVRGATKHLFSNSTAAEAIDATELTSFDVDGFSLGSDISVNGSGESIVAWNWKANGAGVSNTDGTITSTVSANTDSGFSIVTYTGNGTSSQTVGHGLGVTPTFIIIKKRSASDTWNVYHAVGGITGNTILQLNTTDAAVTGSNISITANSTTVGFGSASQVNGSGATFVCYAFSPIPGYSAFGSYTGNGSADGPFVFTGFRPRWILAKCSSTAGISWRLLDTARNTYNVVSLGLAANTSDAETSGDTFCDIVSNGFKIRQSTGAMNTSGATYIYAAFAENPFKISRAR